MSSEWENGLYSADWRDHQRYSILGEYDRVRWAEAWLRRNPAFLKDLQGLPCYVEQDTFGINGNTRIIKCRCEECPLKGWGVRCSRMDGDRPMFFWTAKHNPLVLSVDAEPVVGKAEEAVDLRRCSLLKAVLVRLSNREHLLFSDGFRTLQLTVRGTSVLDGPVNLQCTLHGWPDFKTKTLSLRRLCQLYKQDRLVKRLYPKEQRSSRWAQMLRAWDGCQAGARHRDIAHMIYGKKTAEELWHDGYRTRTQRLIKSARQMVCDGYRNLLT